MTRPGAAVFDLDGTLIDSAGDLRNAVNWMLNQFGCESLSSLEFRSMVGDGVDALIAKALAARRCVGARGLAGELFLEHYAANLTRLTRSYPNAEETLELLHAKGVKLAVCTNKPTDLTRAILKRLALDGYFAHIVGGDSLPFRKPDPRVLAKALTALGATPASTVFVGDSEVDAQTALVAGVPFVVMTHGYHRGPVGDIPCLAAFDTFQQLGKFLAST